MITWLVGSRDSESADAFMLDLRSRLNSRIQLSTDGFGAYYNAVAKGWHWKTEGVDFAQVVKEYGGDPSFATREAHRRYSPAVCTSIQKNVVFGDPDPDKISTSYAERANLSMRMNIRRFTRLTNAFSKKAQNHAYAVSVFYFIYNFGRAHGTLTKAAKGIKTTPAMASGLTDHVWSIEEMLGLMDPARVLQSN
jgi:IS1 family transposase